MLRKTTLFFVFLLSVTLFAAPVSQEQAMREAQAFLNSRTSLPRSMKMRRAYRVPKLKSVSEQSYFYVFNIGTNNGFIIVSGDDRTTPILGYTDAGTFDAGKINPNMKSFLDAYVEEFKQLDKMNVSSRRAPARKAISRSKEPIAPLVAIHWDQEVPYNKLCPEITDESMKKDTRNGRFVTGCVATAMAQVMRYYQWPQGKTLMPIPAYTSKQANLDVSELPVTTFDWRNMRNVYSRNYSPAEADAVAKLMQYCGSSVRMNYYYSSKGGSGAFGSDVPKALKTYFDYAATTKLITRYDYTADTWADALYGELKAKRPVVLCGASPFGGHCFVVDGYAEGEYFHINWGWSGNQDGYYRLSVLEPGAQGIGGFEGGYSQDQQAIIGIQPNKGQPAACTLVGYDIYPSVKTVNRASKDVNFKGADFYSKDDKYSYTFKVLNMEKGPRNCYLSIGLCDENNQLIQVLSNGSEECKYKDYNYYYTIKLWELNDFGANLPLGKYKVFPVYREKTNEDWKLCDGYTKNYVMVEITETQYRVLETEDGSNFNLNATAKIEGTPTVGTPCTFNFDVSNTGSDYYGLVGLRIDKNNVEENVVSLSVARGKKSQISFGYIPKTAGTFKYSLVSVEESYNEATKKWEDIYTEIPGSSSTFIVREAGNGGNLEAEVSIDANKDGVVYGKGITGKFTLTNNASTPYNDKIYVTVFQHSGSKWYNLGDVPREVSVKANGTLTQTFKFVGLSEGQSYLVSVFTHKDGEDWDERGYSAEFKVLPGVTAFYPNGTFKTFNPTNDIDLGNATTIDFGSSTIKGTLAGSTNPNALYYFSDKTNVPSALAGKNIIVNREAEKITLVDDANSDFMPFNDFTVNDITYTRKFEKGYNGTNYNWQTITLPFEVNKITIDNTPYEWFKSKDDKDKSIRLMNVFGEDDAQKIIYYDYVNDFKANQPYIVAIDAKLLGETGIQTVKEVVFHGTNVEIIADAIPVVSGTKYKFIGTYTKETVEKAYQLNATGTEFIAKPSSTIAPFHAYFATADGVIAGEDNTNPLKVDIITPALGITDVDANAVNDTSVIYNLNGVIIGRGAIDFNSLPKGIYIINGKKVVK